MIIEVRDRCGYCFRGIVAAGVWPCPSEAPLHKALCGTISDHVQCGRKRRMRDILKLRVTSVGVDKSGVPLLHNLRMLPDVVKYCTLSPIPDWRYFYSSL